MSIQHSVRRAFRLKKERGWKNWPKMYWAIDIHGTIFKPTYNKHDFVDDANVPEFYPGAIKVLQWLTRREDMIIILWSGSSAEQVVRIMDWLKRVHDIDINYFNENPEVVTNQLSDFDRKFYFDMCLEDKAGFVPESDWLAVKQTLEELGEWNKSIHDS
jgi:hypothetical protein